MSKSRRRTKVTWYVLFADGRIFERPELRLRVQPLSSARQRYDLKLRLWWSDWPSRGLPYRLGATVSGHCRLGELSKEGLLRLGKAVLRELNLQYDYVPVSGHTAGEARVKLFFAAARKRPRPMPVLGERYGQPVRFNELRTVDAVYYCFTGKLLRHLERGENVALPSGIVATTTTVR